MRDLDRPGWRERATVVEYEHTDGRTCPECPGRGQRCRRLSTWWPVIVELKAERTRR